MTKTLEIETLNDEEIKQKAEEYAKLICEQEIKKLQAPEKAELKKMGILKTYFSRKSLDDFPLILFKITNNPYGLSDLAENVNAKLSVDFTFPEECVDKKVRLFFTVLIEKLNKHFDMSKISNDKVKCVSFIQFFNHSQEDTEKTKPKFGKLKINRRYSKNPEILQPYNIEILEHNKPKESNIKEFTDLFTYFKRTTIRLIIKPQFILYHKSSYKNDVRLAFNIIAARILERHNDGLDDSVLSMLGENEVDKKVENEIEEKTNETKTDLSEDDLDDLDDD